MSAEHKKHNPGFLALVDDAKSRIRQVTIDDLARMLAEKEQFVLVDVREESEWAVGHPAGAIHLSKGIIEREIETVAPDKGAKMVLCCGGGYRSALSADSLQKMGYINAVSLDGGWRAYQAAGLPVEK
jgi:rhodanese-related sulfurtransferase